MLEVDGRGKLRSITWLSSDGNLWVTYRCTDYTSVCLEFFVFVDSCLVESSEKGDNSFSWRFIFVIL